MKFKIVIKLKYFTVTYRISHIFKWKNKIEFRKNSVIIKAKKAVTVKEINWDFIN